jgi:hypothetical protein
MLIEILRDTSIAGKAALIGEVVDADEPTARYFLATGKARKVIDQPPAMEPAPEARKPRPRRNPSAKD